MHFKESLILEITLPDGKATKPSKENFWHINWRIQHT
jgi:hypothetical protein